MSLTTEQQNAILWEMLEEGRRLHAQGLSYKEVAAGIEVLRDELVSGQMSEVREDNTIASLSPESLEELSITPEQAAHMDALIAQQERDDKETSQWLDTMSDNE